MLGCVAMFYAADRGEAARLFWRTARYYFFFGVPISLLAFVTGYLTGMSRTGAVGNVLPAVLAFIGGMNIYVFGTENKHKMIIGYCVSLFIVILFYGVHRGSVLREYGREGRLLVLSEQERRIRNYRMNRDLPPEIPSWITTGEPK
jgi:hypothetical protein